MLVRILWRPWIVLSQALMIVVLLSGFVLPVCHRPAGHNEVKIPLRSAVYLFDTRAISSCEEFASENLHRPWVTMAMDAQDQWERMKGNSKVFHPAHHASPECLLQAGLMAL